MDEKEESIKQLLDEISKRYSFNEIESILEDCSIREKIIEYFILSDLNSSENNENVAYDNYFRSLITNGILENGLKDKYKLTLVKNNYSKMMLEVKILLEKKNLMYKILLIPPNKFRQNPKIIELNKSLLMCIINCTLDSIANAFLSNTQNLNEKYCDKTFIQQIENSNPSENDKYYKIIQLLKKHKNSIDIIDIGGESTRPNSDVIDDQIEFDRIGKLITRIKNEEDLKDLVISVDSRKVIINQLSHI